MGHSAAPVRLNPGSSRSASRAQGTRARRPLARRATDVRAIALPVTVELAHLVRARATPTMRQALGDQRAYLDHNERWLNALGSASATQEPAYAAAMRFFAAWHLGGGNVQELTDLVAGYFKAAPCGAPCGPPLPCRALQLASREFAEANAAGIRFVTAPSIESAREFQRQASELEAAADDLNAAAAQATFAVAQQQAQRRTTDQPRRA